MNHDPIETLAISLGVYGTAPMSYLSLLARDAISTRAEFDALVETERTVASIRAMRYSVHALPLDLIPIVAMATHKDNRASVANRARKLGDRLTDLSPAVLQALTSGPMTASAIKKAVDPDDTTGGLFALVIAMLAADHEVVRVPATAGWRSNRLRYARWRDWLPTVDPFELSESEAQRELADRYAAAYGPVTIEDLAWWSGWGIGRATEISSSVDLAVTGSARSLLDGVRLLPAWDVHLVAYKDRSRVVNEDHLPFVYDAMGNAASVVTQNGKVVGVWDLGKKDKPLVIRVAPLTSWSAATWQNVEAQADKIRAFVDAPEVTIDRAEQPTDLTTARKNRHLFPLTD